MKCLSCHKTSPVWKIVGAVAAVAAVGAALYWLLCAKRRKAACLCDGDDGVCCFGEDVPEAPCADYSDGTAAEEAEETAEKTADDTAAKETPEA